MDVLGVGVLITGDSGVGKSELALELISRGQGLVADDVVEISRIAATTLEGRCPPLLKDFLEVRGLGLINIRTIYGETAVRPKMKLQAGRPPREAGQGRGARQRRAPAAVRAVGGHPRRHRAQGGDSGRRRPQPGGAARGRGAQLHPAAARQGFGRRIPRAPEAGHGERATSVQLVLVSGLSGSGKSIALDVLEDSDYYCVDNLPATLLPDVVKFLAGRRARARRGQRGRAQRRRDFAAAAPRLAQGARRRYLRAVSRGERRGLAAALLRDAAQPSAARAPD